MNESARATVVVALVALSLVALATAITLVAARSRTRLRAPLATALTFVLLALSGAAGIASIATLSRSGPLAIAAAIASGVAVVSIARVGLLRREHPALIGGSVTLGEAHEAARATLRALVATARLAERLDAADTPEDVETMVADAARRALPDAVVQVVAADEPAPAGIVIEQPLRDRVLRATYAEPLPPGDEDRSAAEIVLRALASEAILGLDRLDGRHAAAAEVRRREVQRVVDQRMATAADAFGACHLAAQAAGEQIGARSVEIVGADGELSTFALVRDRKASGQTVEVLLARSGGQLKVELPANAPLAARAVVEGIGDALDHALAAHATRRAATAARARQAAITAAAATVQGPPDVMLRGILEAARGAFNGDAAILYAVRDGAPVALEAVGVDPGQFCDGIARQAIAAARVVLDPDGEHLVAGEIGDLRSGLAVPLPGGLQTGALSVLFRDVRALDERDGEDLSAFARLAVIGVDRAALDRELDRRELLRAGFVEIADTLAGPREPAETYAAVATAARRALQAASAVVVTGSDDLMMVGAAPAPSALIDEGGAAGSLLQLAARDGRIVLCVDARSDRRLPAAERRRLIESGNQAALCVPIGAGDAGVAVLGVVWAEPHAASDDDLELARHLATVAGSAIERAETLASERRARSRAQELQRIGGLMASNLDAPAVLREIVSQAALLLHADSCALRLVEGDRLVVRAVQGDAAEILAGEQTALSGGPTGEVLARRTPVAVSDMAADDRFLPDDPLLQARFSAYLGAPILSPDGELRGVLALYDRRRRVWKPDEIEALEAFANSATVALQNALLYQRVAQEKEKSEAIIASIADGIVVVDTDGRVEMWNRAAAAMTGVSSRVALRRTLRDLLKGELGDHDDAAGSALADAVQSGGAVEVRLARGEREIWLAVRAAQLRDPVEDRVGTVYALRDVSAERQLDQLKSDFVATVSHELRTPLTSIYGFAETLLRSDVSFPEEDRTTFLGYIASESERLTRLVDGLLSVTRLEAGGVELDLADVDVGDVLREIVLRQSERVRETHQVELSLPPDPLIAAADRDKLRQIALNLVDNAIKYSPNGGTITVAARRNLDMVEVRVADQGIGISAADQRNLFRKFFRADARMTRGIRGIGLGLYLTRGFVTAMGGRIRVESEAGKGSTFIVDLPLRRRAGGGTKARAAA